jgi:hypothetical protein
VALDSDGPPEPQRGRSGGACVGSKQQGRPQEHPPVSGQVLGGPRDLPGLPKQAATLNLADREKGMQLLREVMARFAMYWIQSAESPLLAQKILERSIRVSDGY